MSDSRTRVLDAINHRQPDRVPVDFGSMTSTGMHCSIIAGLRDYFGLEKRPVKAFEPYQMLGWIDDDLREAMDLDAAMVMPVGTNFGNTLGEWKEWRTLWGQDVLIPKGMELDQTEDGGYVVYPQGDRSVPPCAKMPASGYFFDAIERQEEYDEDNPDPRDNAADFSVLSDAALAQIAVSARTARKTGKLTLFTLPGGSLSSPSQFAGMSQIRPKGMRKLADWYMAMVAMPEFVKGVFAIQTEVTLTNLDRVYKAAGGDIDVLMLCTGDFGTQINTFFSCDTFNDLFVPFYQRITGWIHANTPWKVFKHSCGAVEPLINSMIASGIDILNPVQCSAAGMDPSHLKKAYGDRIVFWGGGIDTQRTLPFGSPEECRRQAIERCRVFSPGGGFVFNAIHNVQALTPVANVIAMLEGVREFNAAGR